MKLEKRVPSGREKDEAAVELLAKLREKLHSENVSTARLAAFNLSWKQEDGLDILKETLVGRRFSRTAKKAAAYGLRSMKGRMKKMAVEVLKDGLKNSDRTTRAACEKALLLMAGMVPKKPSGGRRPRPGSGRPGGIRSVPRRGNRPPRPMRRGTPSNR